MRNANFYSQGDFLMKLLVSGLFGSGLRRKRQSGQVWKLASMVFAACLFLAGTSSSSMAKDDVQISKQKPKVNAITGSAWQAEVTPAEPQGHASLPQDQQALLAKINSYMQKFQ